MAKGPITLELHTLKENAPQHAEDAIAVSLCLCPYDSSLYPQPAHSVHCSCSFLLLSSLLIPTWPWSPQLCPTQMPICHVSASHSCPLVVQFPPVHIFLHSVSESRLQSPFPISYFHFGCYCHSICFHIFTLSTANTAQVCNKFQLTHFLFFPSIYSDAFYQFCPQGILCPLLGPYKTVEVTVFLPCIPIHLQHLWSSGHYRA